jgi:23S rRNA pseudouridine955/2504/2580 synthase
MNHPPAVLFEDEHLLALDKPAGVLTEGGADREEDLEQMATRLTGKPAFACHRLDRITSGVVLLRKGRQHKAAWADLFAEHRVRKLYWAIVTGSWPKGLHTVETQIASAGAGRWANVAQGGKTATSTFQILGTLPEKNLTWLGVLLKTGRTHQARLHCLHAGCPILGDPLYGPKPSPDFFGLHARELRFRHPLTGQELTLIAPPPPAWDNLLQELGAQPD